jgi:hypothetical protein
VAGGADQVAVSFQPSAISHQPSATATATATAKAKAFRGFKKGWVRIGTDY